MRTRVASLADLQPGSMRQVTAAAVADGLTIAK